MRRIPHRVDSKRAVAPSRPLPRDTWQGQTFVTAEGQTLESLWSGRGPLPGTHPWPDGLSDARARRLR